MTTLQDRLAEATQALNAAGIDGAVRDARLLVAHVHQINVSRLTLHLRDDDGWGNAQELYWHDCLAARCEHKPIAKITGRKAFWGRDFWVNDNVLDPRPETETLIAAALECSFVQVLDIGTGSGAIILTLLAERPGARGVGTDISQQALIVARHNADQFSVADRLVMQQADMWAGVTGRFDLIVSNPPYLAAAEMEDVPPDTLFDPRISLTDEADGLTFYRQIAGRAMEFLSGPGAKVLVEIGPSQGAAVQKMFIDAGFDGVTILPDLDGRDRVIDAKWPDTA
ncbi:MAG: peptide chain release factor N(5)-glutamine methyltransferase [Pseudomonadota bacterium]